jgi:peptidoglycan/LPS O-acetylase OafA/YrhL
LKYRAEIDGLRAMAVVPVILFHAGFDFFDGGFIGVDIFFVISGYLITTILLYDLMNNQFSLVKFYERRARRILPALFFVITMCLPFAWIWMLPSEMKDFAQSVVATSLFSSNILFMQESGYFADIAEVKPLLHTWSLAVEEQYYLFFPIVLFFAWPFGEKRVFWVICLVAALSLLLAEWSLRNQHLINFYSIQTRAWELLAGSIAAFLVQKNGLKESNSLSILGLSLIIFSIIIFDETTPFPSLYTLFPVIGVMLVILFGAEKTLTAKILSNRIFVGFGLISYSLYLWHQPIFAFAKIRLIEHPSSGFIFTLCVASTILAYLTWRFIEQPFRNPLYINRKHIFLASGFCIILFLSIGITGHIQKGFPDRLPKQLVAALSNYDNEQMRLIGKGCHLSWSDTIPTMTLPACGVNLKNSNVDILLVGDSHLDSVGVQLLEQIEKLDLSAYALSYSGCVPISGLTRNNKDKSYDCPKYNKIIREYAELHGVKTIILVSRFPLYLLGTRYDNGEGGIEEGTPVPFDLNSNITANIKADDPDRIQRVSERYRNDIYELTKSYNVIVFNPIPVVGWRVPSYYGKIFMHNADLASANDFTIYHSYDQYLVRTMEFTEILNSINSDNLYTYQVEKLFCNEVNRRCKANIGNNLLYRDVDHLSPYAANLVAHDFIKKFQPVLTSAK